MRLYKASKILYPILFVIMITFSFSPSITANTYVTEQQERNRLTSGIELHSNVRTPHLNRLSNAQLNLKLFQQQIFQSRHDTILEISDPEPEDLVETEDVKITEEIRRLAVDELKSDPLKIFLYVYNEIGFIPYGWSLQGSAMTLATGYGNDYDQSSLLIALYRAAGIPAKYMQGFVKVSPKRLANWVGADDDLMAMWICLEGSMEAVPNYSDEGQLIDYALIHCWVAAYISGEWVELDPSFKEYKYYKKMGFSDVADEFIQEMKPVDGVSYEDWITNLGYGEHSRMLDQFRNRIILKLNSLPEDTKLKSVTGGQVIIKTDDFISPPELLHPKAKFESVSLSEDDRYNVAFMFPAFDPNQLSGFSQDTFYIYNVSTVNLAGKRITLSFPPTGEQDYEKIKSYGGLSSTPCDEYTVTPVILIDGKPVLAGDPMKPGLGFPYKIIRYFHKWEKEESPDILERTIPAGSYVAISLHVLGMPLDYENKIQSLRDIDKLDTIPVDDLTGETLNLRAMLFWSLMDQYRETIALENDVVSLVGFPNLAQSGYMVRKKISDDREYLEFDKSFMDIHLVQIFLPRTADHPEKITPKTDSSYVREDPKAISAYFMYSLIGAYLEAYIFYMLYNLPPTGGLYLIISAIQRGLPIYVVNSENFNEAIGNLEYDPSIKERLQTSIRQEIDSGKIVFIPARAIKSDVLRISVSTDSSEYRPRSYETFGQVGYLTLNEDGFLGSTTIMTFEEFSGGLGGIEGPFLEDDLYDFVGATAQGGDSVVFEQSQNVVNWVKDHYETGRTGVKIARTATTVAKWKKYISSGWWTVGIIATTVVETIIEDGKDLSYYWKHSSDPWWWKVPKIGGTFLLGGGVHLISPFFQIGAGVGEVGLTIGRNLADPKKLPLSFYQGAWGNAVDAFKSTGKDFDEYWKYKRRDLLDPVAFSKRWAPQIVSPQFQIGFVAFSILYNSHYLETRNIGDKKEWFVSLISTSGMTTGFYKNEEWTIDDMPNTFFEDSSDTGMEFNIWDPLSNENEETYKLVISNQEGVANKFYVQIELSGGGEMKFFKEVELSLSEGEEVFIPLQVTSNPIMGELEVNIEEPHTAYTVLLKVDLPLIRYEPEIYVDDEYLTSMWTGGYKVLAFEEGTEHTIRLSPPTIDFENGTQLRLEPHTWVCSERDAKIFQYSSGTHAPITPTSPLITPTTSTSEIYRSVDQYTPYIGPIVVIFIISVAVLLHRRKRKVEAKVPKEALKYCIACGSQIRVENRYCTKCGEPQE